ncbi:putative metal-binding motif-containing protein [Candidatus Uhrbacteria bacterium]|nr:putative metal-binding motif-containing protein [Candidatus Uhrbacteria bacterium]
MKRFGFFVFFSAIFFQILGVQQCSDEDADGDGWTVEDGDCDDTNSFVHPGAQEVCDLADNDCDGTVDEDIPDCELTGICTDPSATIDEFSFDCVDNDIVSSQENILPQNVFFCFYNESVLIANQDVQVQGYNLWTEEVTAGNEDEVSLFVWKGYSASVELSEGWYGTSVETTTDLFRLDIVTPQEPEKFDQLFATGFVEFRDTGEEVELIAVAAAFDVQWGQGESEEGCIEHLQDF